MFLLIRLFKKSNSETARGTYITDREKSIGAIDSFNPDKNSKFPNRKIPETATAIFPNE